MSVTRLRGQTIFIWATIIFSLSCYEGNDEILEGAPGELSTLISPISNNRDLMDDPEILKYAESGDLQSLKKAASQNANLNYRDPKGRNALMLASIYGKEEIIKYLLENGLSVNLVDFQGQSALYFAIRSGKLPIVNQLVDAKCNLNIKDKSGLTPLMMAASRPRNKSILEFLIKSKADLNSVDQNGNSILHFAEKSQDPENIQVVKNHLKDPVLQRDEPKNENHLKFLEMAFEGNLEKVAGYFSNIGNINFQDSEGDTALHKSSLDNLFKKLETLKFLLEKHADPNIKNVVGDTPLMNAVRTKNTKAVELLLQFGADANDTNKKGSSSLIMASMRPKSLEIVKKLFKGVRDPNFKDKNGETALTHAVRTGNEEVVEYLLKMGVEINFLDKDGNLPIFTAINNNNQKIIELLINYGHPLNIADNTGHTPLMVAAKNNNPLIFKKLLDKGANKNFLNKEGKTAYSLYMGGQNLNKINEKVANLKKFVKDLEDDKVDLDAFEFDSNFGIKEDELFEPGKIKLDNDEYFEPKPIFEKLIEESLKKEKEKILNHSMSLFDGVILKINNLERNTPAKEKLKNLENDIQNFKRVISENKVEFEKFQQQTKFDLQKINIQISQARKSLLLAFEQDLKNDSRLKNTYDVLNFNISNLNRIINQLIEDIQKREKLIQKLNIMLNDFDDPDSEFNQNKKRINYSVEEKIYHLNENKINRINEFEKIKNGHEHWRKSKENEISNLKNEISILVETQAFLKSQYGNLTESYIAKVKAHEWHMNNERHDLPCKTLAAMIQAKDQMDNFYNNHRAQMSDQEIKEKEKILKELNNEFQIELKDRVNLLKIEESEHYSLVEQTNHTIKELEIDRDAVILKLKMELDSNLETLKGEYNLIEQKIEDQFGNQPKRLVILVREYADLLSASTKFTFERDNLNSKLTNKASQILSLYGTKEDLTLFPDKFREIYDIINSNLFIWNGWNSPRFSTSGADRYINEINSYQDLLKGKKLLAHEKFINFNKVIEKISEEIRIKEKLQNELKFEIHESYEELPDKQKVKNLLELKVLRENLVDLEFKILRDSFVSPSQRGKKAKASIEEYDKFFSNFLEKAKTLGESLPSQLMKKYYYKDLTSSSDIYGIGNISDDVLGGITYTGEDLISAKVLSSIEEIEFVKKWFKKNFIELDSNYQTFYTDPEINIYNQLLFPLFYGELKEKSSIKKMVLENGQFAYQVNLLNENFWVDEDGKIQKIYLNNKDEIGENYELIGGSKNNNYDYFINLIKLDLANVDKNLSQEFLDIVNLWTGNLNASQKKILDGLERALRNYKNLNEADLHKADQMNAKNLGLISIQSGLESLKEAAKLVNESDDNSSKLRERLEEAVFLENIGKIISEVALNFTPVVEQTKDVYELVTGRNYLTGDPLSKLEITFIALNIATLGSSKWGQIGFKAIKRIFDKGIKKGFNYLNNIEVIKENVGKFKYSAAKLGIKGQNRIRAFGEYLKLSLGNEVGAIGKIDNAIKDLGEHGFILVDEGSKIRKVTLKPLENPRWGLTEEHLKKHFFGESEFALNKIDPAGNADKWKNHLAELFNSPVTSVTSNGKLDIIKEFPKSDGSGMFKMGIRLSESADGSFDLITVLTKQ